MAQNRRFCPCMERPNQLVRATRPDLVGEACFKGEGGYLQELEQLLRDEPSILVRDEAKALEAREKKRGGDSPSEKEQAKKKRKRRLVKVLTLAPFGGNRQGRGRGGGTSPAIL
ncbi:hypothetical protein ACLOJK_005250 [Asimina triloba]